MTEDSIFNNRVSGNRCRFCGKVGCEGGPSCRNEDGEPA